MKRTWIYDEQGHPHEFVREVSKHHFVQPDILEHGGRAKWRERLKRNGSIEIAPKDLIEYTQKWNSKKADFHSKLKDGERQGVRPVDTDVMAAPDHQRSILNREVLNRLDGRPVPERKMLIKLTLDTMRMLRNR